MRERNGNRSKEVSKKSERMLEVDWRKRRRRDERGGKEMEGRKEGG